MKLTEVQRRLILAAIGLIYIILGVVQGVFKVKIDQSLMNQIALVLLVAALWLFIAKPDSARNRKPEDKVPAEQLEDKNKTQS